MDKASKHSNVKSKAACSQNKSLDQNPTLAFKILKCIYHNRVLSEIKSHNMFWLDVLHQQSGMEISVLEFKRFIDNILENISDYQLPPAMAKYFKSKSAVIANSTMEERRSLFRSEEAMLVKKKFLLHIEKANDDASLNLLYKQLKGISRIITAPAPAVKRISVDSGISVSFESKRSKTTTS